MYETRGRTSLFNPTNFKAGMDALNDSQNRTIRAMKEEKADVRYRAGVDRQENRQNMNQLAQGLDGIGKAMRQQKVDSQVKEQRDLQNKETKQRIDYNKSTAEARRAKVVNDGKISEINLNKSEESVAINKGIMEASIATFKGVIPEGLSTEAQYGYVQAGKASDKEKAGKLKDDMSIKVQQAQIDNIEDDNERADKQLALEKKISESTIKKNLASYNATIATARHASGQSAKAVNDRSETLSRNPVASHQNPKRTPQEQKQYAVNSKVFDAEIKQVKARAMSRASAMRIFELGGVSHYLKEDGTLTPEGAKAWKAGGIRGIVNNTFGGLEDKSKMKQIDAEMQNFLKAAAMDGTFGALNFAREIERAFEQAGGNPSDVNFERMNMSKAVDDAFGSSAAIDSFAKVQASHTNKSKKKLLAYMKTGSYGEQNHMALVEAVRSLGPTSMVKEGGANYVPPGGYLKDDPDAEGTTSAQIMMNNVFGTGAIDVTGQFDRNFKDEVYWRSGEGRRATEKQLADLEAQNLNSDKNFFTDKNARDERLASSPVYKEKVLPEEGPIAASNGVGQVQDAATAYPNNMLVINPDGQPVSVSSASGTTVVGATSKAFDPLEAHKKQSAKKYGYGTFDEMSTDIFSISTKSKMKSKSGTAYAN